jgi:DNA ligase-1
MTLPTLYSRTNTGAIQTWTVEVDGDSYRTIHGQLNGKLQATAWTVCIITNEGRANERTPLQQAIFEAEAMWTKKSETGYFQDMSDIDIKFYVEPMLAKKWEDRKDKIKFPVYTQPKLDGLRAVITRNGAKSRNGKDWVTIPHILNALKPIFDKYPDLILDGELYNHELKHDFNKITSLVKKTKPNDTDLEESAKVVQFHWYDTASAKFNFRQRKNWIKTLKQDFNLPDCIQVVSTHRVDDLETLDNVYAAYLSKGYEGQMVRLDTPYEFKRSSNLLKRKEFQDEEYKILDIVEGVGNRAGLAGAMVFKNELDHDFNSNIKGDREYLKELLDNKDQYIGQLATVRYFNKTPDKLIPRFPFVYGIRNYE